MSKKLMRMVSTNEGPRGWCHYCPACKSIHCFSVEKPNESNGARWTFNGNQEKPTFTPSMLIYVTNPPKEKWRLRRTDKTKTSAQTWGSEAAATAAAPGPHWVAFKESTAGSSRVTICHYHLTDGVLRYLNDCRHSLAGQKVALPDMPESYGAH